MVTFGVEERSLIYWIYRSGEIQDPCGTPASIFLVDDRKSEIFTLNLRFERNDCIILIRCLEVLVIVCNL